MVWVTDGIGCVSDSFNCGPASDSITLASNPEIEIDILNIINNICFGARLGEFTLDVTGGIPNYFISLLDENNNITTSYNTTISDLASSDYMVWVIDGIGCVSDTTFNVKLGEPGRIQIHNNIENLSCYMLEDGVMNLSLLSGAPPYNYVVEYDNMMIGQSQVNQAIVFNLEELSEGEYYISVTDFNIVPEYITATEYNAITESGTVTEFNTITEYNRVTNYSILTKYTKFIVYFPNTIHLLITKRY
jgi:hypothetical protein